LWPKFDVLTLFIFYENLKNLCEEFVTEHCIKIPSQSPNEFASSWQIEAIEDLAIQFGWQFAMATRRRQIG
jgi:hypothetical protein